MKLTQTIVHKTFHVQLGEKTYYVDFLDSDLDVISLSNRNTWEIYDENNEPLDLYTYYEKDKERLNEIKQNWKLARKLIRFCQKYFKKYNPNIRTL